MSGHSPEPSCPVCDGDRRIAVGQGQRTDIIPCPACVGIDDEAVSVAEWEDARRQCAEAGMPMVPLGSGIAALATLSAHIEPGGPHDGVRIDRLARILRLANMSPSEAELTLLLAVKAPMLDGDKPPGAFWQRLAMHFLRELHAPYGIIDPDIKPHT